MPPAPSHHRAAPGCAGTTPRGPGWRPSPSAARAVSPDPSDAATPSDQPSPAPSEPVIAAGPAGTPIILASGPVPDLDNQFDPHGPRLGVWVADPADQSVGTLRLVVLDPSAGTI